MRRTAVALVGLVVVAITTMHIGTSTARPLPSGARLEMYVTTVDADTLQHLVRAGYDIASVKGAPDGIDVALVLGPSERRGLRARGLELSVWRDAKGRTQSDLAAVQAGRGFKVWRPYDGRGGIAAELRRLARRHPDIAELRVLGSSHRGRDIIAIRLTQDVADVNPGSRPAVLYQGTTHAREWISTEVTRRLLRWFIASARTNRTVQRILQRTELWFVPIVNPDGYQYTFDADRLWRKNLRDNNGNGAIDLRDGVDLNRNYPEHWNYDEEGSSSMFTDETYRGPAPASEPETQADMSLFDLADIRFAISYHSFGRLLLYPQGWQVQTPSADDPVYVALTGTDRRPAVAGFDPGVGADLYITNGEFTDWAHGVEEALAWTPELSEGCRGCGFVFPDRPRLVRAEFERNLGFAVRVARSARDPDDPVSHFGADTKDLYLDVSNLDPSKTHNPLSDLTFEVSYAGGSDQPVDVLAKRSLRDVTLRYRVNGGPKLSRRARPTPDGEVFNDGDYSVFYRYLRGEIPNLSVGDTVTYWFTAVRSGNGPGASATSSRRSTFRVVRKDDADVLVLAAEDRTGSANAPRYRSTAASTPNYLSFYTSALQAAGIDFDVYDIDARGRRAPDHLGVLSHYDAVVWYSGNDQVTRNRRWGPGNVSRLANDLTLEVRQYLNEGGKVLYTGQWAGAVENGHAGVQFYDPVANRPCVVDDRLVLTRCQFMADKNDFLQYYLGADLYVSGSARGRSPVIDGVGAPYAGTSWSLNGDDSARNQVHTGTFATTSSVLQSDRYPQFAGDAPAQWRRARRRFEPFDGRWYLYSERGDASYKRVRRTIDLTRVRASEKPAITFNLSYDTEPDWDYVFVEARTAGRNDWTTLRDRNGHTSRATGQSCAAGWFELHPRLRRYQGPRCRANAARAEWHASSGRSRGWERWRIDLSRYAGGRVEVSIAYVSDWAIQGLGAFVDDIEVSAAAGATSFEADADPLDGWRVSRPPPGSPPNPNNWTRTTSVGIEEGPVVSTDDSLHFGFGFEGIAGADTRAAVMRRSIARLLG